MPARVESRSPIVSVVMPCLDEERTIEQCIHAALAGIAATGHPGEVLVADNGSADGTKRAAADAGARVIDVDRRGYGAAIQGGCDASLGRLIVIGDGDASYDFTELPRLIRCLENGADLVVGNRFAGGIENDAMPWMHRHIGNPILSALGRLFFHSGVRDFHCGLRAITRDAYEKLALTATGMEFASEMIAKASLFRMKIAEVPVTLHRDGRDRPPHLRTWRDGWRHLRFMLLFSPRWLFLIPGLMMLTVGLAAVAWLVPGGHRVASVGFDINTLLVAGFLCVLGYQIVVFAAFASAFAIREGIHPVQSPVRPWYQRIRLEIGIIGGLAGFVAGALVLMIAAIHWATAGFPALDPRQSMRVVIPSVVLATLGVQTVFASFFLSILDIPTRTAITSGTSGGRDLRE